MCNQNERVRDNAACQQAINKAAMDWADQQLDWKGVAILVGSHVWAGDIAEPEEDSLLFWGEAILRKMDPEEEIVLLIRINSNNQARVIIQVNINVAGRAFNVAFELAPNDPYKSSWKAWVTTGELAGLWETNFLRDEAMAALLRNIEANLNYDRTVQER